MMCTYTYNVCVYLYIVVHTLYIVFSWMSLSTKDLLSQFGMSLGCPIYSQIASPNIPHINDAEYVNSWEDPKGYKEFLKCSHGRFFLVVHDETVQLRTNYYPITHCPY